MSWFRLVYNWYIYAPFADLQPMLNKCCLVLLKWIVLTKKAKKQRGTEQILDIDKKTCIQ